MGFRLNMREMALDLINQRSSDVQEKFKFLPNEKISTIDATNAALSKMFPASEINIELDVDKIDVSFLVIIVE